MPQTYGEQTRLRGRHVPLAGLLLLVGLLLGNARPLAAAERRPPNIVLILADDLGYSDLACYGSDRIQTPNLDRMAAEGARFTDFYACAPVCTPSRSGLLTGRYPLRTGLTRVLFPYSQNGIDAEETTLAEALRDAGYATACVGKWHLGHLPRYLPTRHGFDRYFGIPYSNDMKPTPLLLNERTVEEPADQASLTERYTQEAVRFIRDSRGRRFFLYLPHTYPHVPLHASDRFRGRSPRGLYGDVVEAIDWSTGEILKTLKETGLDQDTLVIFTSDNGPWLQKGEDGGSAGPLRDGKGTTYEGGMREPFIARWPGHIPAGRVCREVASNLDLLPTLVRLAGGRLPDRPLDGRDMLGLLTGERSRNVRPFLYYNGEQLQAIRSGRWKLHLARRAGARERPPELYDLSEDVSETRSLADSYPEVVHRLQRQARAMDARVRRGAAPLKR